MQWLMALLENSQTMNKILMMDQWPTRMHFSTPLQVDRHEPIFHLFLFSPIFTFFFSIFLLLTVGSCFPSKAVPS